MMWLRRWRRVTRTLRFRLTAWYALALAMGLCVFGMVLMGLAERHLLHSHDESLTLRAHAVLFILEQGSHNGDLSPTQLDQFSRLGRVAIQMRGNGQESLIYRSPELLNAPVLARAAEEQEGPKGNGRFFTVIQNGDYWRIYTLHYRRPGGLETRVRVLEELGDVDASLKRLQLAFFHLAPIGIIISVLGALIISTKALAPLTTIIDMAAEIGPHELSKRLPHPDVYDELGRLVHTINRMIGRIQASFEAMKRFTSDASHELRNPLATLRNTVDVTLELQRTSEEKDEALRSIGEEVDRIRNLVEDLLLLARADSGRVVMEMRPVPLAFILEAQVEAYQVRAEEQNISLEIGALVHDEIPGNERWLHQVVGNLISNAINYTPEGGKVTVNMTRGDEVLAFSVLDTGPGLPEEDLDRVFERFHRSDPSRSWGHVQGHGLGLAIAAWVVGEHKGHIEAFNRLEGGARFTVTLPYAKA